MELKNFILPSNIFVIYTSLEVLLTRKISGHTHFLTESINLKDEFYRRYEIQNEQHYRTVLDEFHTQQMEFLVKSKSKKQLIQDLKSRNIC